MIIFRLLFALIIFVGCTVLAAFELKDEDNFTHCIFGWCYIITFSIIAIAVVLFM